MSRCVLTPSSIQPRVAIPVGAVRNTAVKTVFPRSMGRVVLPSVEVFCAFGFPAQVVAEEPSSTVDEVVVTATKIERPARYVTDSVTVITAEEIRERNFTDTTEILRQTAGIAFKQAGGPGQFNYPKVRGFGAGHFLVVVDGVKINEGLFPGVGNFIGQIDPKLIERIEILRGPQADLYGSDSTAGVIAITTKEPLPGTNTTLGGELGSLDWKKGYGSLRGTTGDFGYSVNVAYTDSGGGPR